MLVGFAHHRLAWGQPHRHDPRALHAKVPRDEDFRLEQQRGIDQVRQISGEPLVSG